MALSGLGMGLLVPSSNNAGLDLLPQRAAVISGIRGLFRSTGGVVGTAIIVLWLELSPDKAAGMRTIFTVLGVLMLLTIPLVFLIPDRARERISRRGPRRDRAQRDGAGSRARGRLSRRDHRQCRSAGCCPGAGPQKPSSCLRHQPAARAGRRI